MSTYLETTHRNVIWLKRAAAENELELECAIPAQSSVDR